MEGLLVSEIKACGYQWIEWRYFFARWRQQGGVSVGYLVDVPDTDALHRTILELLEHLLVRYEEQGLDFAVFSVDAVEGTFYSIRFSV
jgi:hypothetical protein